LNFVEKTLLREYCRKTGGPYRLLGRGEDTRCRRCDSDFAQNTGSFRIAVWHFTGDLISSSSSPSSPSRSSPATVRYQNTERKNRKPKNFFAARLGSFFFFSSLPYFLNLLQLNDYSTVPKGSRRTPITTTSPTHWIIRSVLASYAMMVEEKNLKRLRASTWTRSYENAFLFPLFFFF
jgi:hypothetical protein